MTIDKNRLKELAEAATPGPWIADNERHEGAINTVDRHIGMVSLYAETREGVSQNFINQEFIATANPAAILAMLGEIQGLQAQHGRDSAELRRLCSARDDAKQQRDQLKAENESLRGSCKAMGKDMAKITRERNSARSKAESLKAENEALRTALIGVINHVEGNTECLVRDLVNWGTPKIDANDFYVECEQIVAIAQKALDAANAAPCESSDLSTKGHGDSEDLSTNCPDELAELRRDAGRYRALRQGGYLDTWVDLHVCDEPRRAELTDAAIDAAMAKEAGQ